MIYHIHFILNAKEKAMMKPKNKRMMKKRQAGLDVTGAVQTALPETKASPGVDWKMILTRPLLFYNA